VCRREIGRVKQRLTTAPAAGAAVALVVLLLTVPTLTTPAPAMDEGTLLAYPERVLAGDVPHRDFLTFYGPGGPWLLAGIYEVAGAHLMVERAVGALYRLLVVAGVFGLAVLWGRFLAAASGLFAGVLLVTFESAAYPWYAALALASLGLLMAARACRQAPESREQGREILAGGVLSGAALLFRPDFAPAVLLGALPLLLVLPGSARRRYVLGFLLGVAAYVPHLLIVGPDALDRLLSDLLESSPGRRLPLPGPSTKVGILLAAATGSTFLFLVLGAVLTRSRRRDSEARLVLAIGLFLVALLPFMASRADLGHVVAVACVAVGLLPVAITIVLRELSAPVQGLRRELVAAAIVAFVLALTSAGAVGDRVKELLGLTDRPRSFEVEHDGRAWLVESEELAHDAEALLSELERRSAEGDALFVGPHDLRRSNYTDTFIYHLMPELEPASYFMELNPQTANRRGSGLAGELEKADFVVLNERWDDWNEPNESSDLGPATPNAVVRERFCLRARKGPLELYERCRRSRPSSPRDPALSVPTRPSGRPYSAWSRTWARYTFSTQSPFDTAWERGPCARGFAAPEAA
jgi:hypothetical protein